MVLSTTALNTYDREYLPPTFSIIVTRWDGCLSHRKFYYPLDHDHEVMLIDSKGAIDRQLATCLRRIKGALKARRQHTMYAGVLALMAFALFGAVRLGTSTRIMMIKV